MLDSFKNRMERIGKTQSSSYLHNAEKAIDFTFTRDPAYREVIVTHAPSGIKHRKYDAKFMIETRRSVSGDEESYRLMLRPHVHIPIGSYVDIPDADGVKQRWLVCLQDNQPQFPVYYILKCNWTLKWVYGGKVYKCECVQRTQSSYNSGEWSRDYFTVVQDQTIMILPTTPYTQTITYNQRVLINDNNRMVPIAWHVSKVLDTIPLGITRLTLAQSQADLQEDCGKYGIANWCTCPNHSMETCSTCQIAEPTYIDAGLEIPIIASPTGKISYNGKDNTLRVGGSAKTFIASFWDTVNQTYVNHKPMWKLSLKDDDTLLCSVDLDFDSSQSDGDNVYLSWHVALADDCPNGVTLGALNFDNVAATTGTADGCTISCISNSKVIFNVHVEPSKDNVHALVLRCMQLYSMVGKTIIVSAENDQGQYTTETTMEVIS